MLLKDIRERIILMSNNLLDFVQRIKESKVYVPELDGFGEDSRIIDTEFKPEIGPLTFDLYSYQNRAVELTLKYGRSIIGFPPGLGKTISALTVVANYKEKAVIVHPPSLRFDPWIEEITKNFPSLTFYVAQGLTPNPIPDDVDIVLIGDRVINEWSSMIKKWNPKILVADEAHRFKNHMSQRSQGVLTVAEHVRKNNGIVTLLTGTLAPNDAAEVYSPVNIVGQAFNIANSESYKAWIRKFCFIDEIPREKTYRKKDGTLETKTIWVEKPHGSLDPVGLNERLRDTCYFRVEREQVLDMPPKLYVQHYIQPSKDGLTEYRQVLKDYRQWRKDNQLTQIENEKAEKLAQLGKLVEMAALAVTESAAEYVYNMVEQGEPVVVMAHHKSVVKAFRESLSTLGVESVTITGSDSQDKKQQNLEAFKTGKVKVLVGNISAAGTGLNLDVASNMVFIQLPWSPADFDQASDRIYRVTQKNTCIIHTIYLKNSATQLVLKRVHDKAVVTNQINSGAKAGGFMESQELIDELLEDILSAEV